MTEEKCFDVSDTFKVRKGKKQNGAFICLRYFSFRRRRFLWCFLLLSFLILPLFTIFPADFPNRLRLISEFLPAVKLESCTCEPVRCVFSKPTTLFTIEKCLQTTRFQAFISASQYQLLADLDITRNASCVKHDLKIASFFLHLPCPFRTWEFIAITRFLSKLRIPAISELKLPNPLFPALSEF